VDRPDGHRNGRVCHADDAARDVHLDRAAGRGEYQWRVLPLPDLAAMMTTRILPDVEYARLADTPLAPAWPRLVGQDATIVVVEAEGRIVATGALVRLLHGEEVWVDPAYRGAGGALRPLLEGLSEAARAQGAEAVVASTVSSAVAERLEHAGGLRWPGFVYRVPVLPAKE
jgi:GNAT superfamily N-acetyltransferase